MPVTCSNTMLSMLDYVYWPNRHLSIRECEKLLPIMAKNNTHDDRAKDLNEYLELIES